jgi:hypothetical protein
VAVIGVNMLILAEDVRKPALAFAMCATDSLAGVIATMEINNIPSMHICFPLMKQSEKWSLLTGL